MNSEMKDYVVVMILNPEHRCLVEKNEENLGGALIRVPREASERPLVTARKYLKEKYDFEVIGGPVGHYWQVKQNQNKTQTTGQNIERTPFNMTGFIFILPHDSFVSIDMNHNHNHDLGPELNFDHHSNNQIKHLHLVPIQKIFGNPEHVDFDLAWSMYTETLLGGFIPPQRHLDIMAFGNSPQLASKLAHLVIKGQKRATAGLTQVMNAQNLMIPYPGLLSIVTDGFGIPLCCIETAQVRFLKFKDVPEEMSLAEGEGDLSLEDWKEGHWRYFQQESEAGGFEFNENSEIFNEYFKLIKVFQSPIP